MSEETTPAPASACETPLKSRTISFIDEDELQVHKLYRERINQEDNLVNHRMSWMVLSQAFLFATWGTLHSQFGASLTDLNGSRRFFYLISVVGAIFALGSWLSLHAARGEIAELRDDFLDLYPIDGKGRKVAKKPSITRGSGTRVDVLPRLTGAAHFHWMGHVVPAVMPWVLIFLWFCLAFITYAQSHPDSFITGLVHYISNPSPAPQAVPPPR